MSGALTHLDLFSGIGGFSIAAEACGFETVAFCEIDPEARLVTDHFWPHVPNLHDIRTLSRSNYTHRLPDLITGGVPCQPASALGLMRGTSDERWLWPEATRIMREFRPSYGIFENPPAILTLEQGDAWNGIVSGLVALGYDCWWDVFPAAAFGAGHLRERVILVCAQNGAGDVADAASFRPRGETDAANAEPVSRNSRLEPSSRSYCAALADANGQGLQGHAWNGANGQGWQAEARRPVAPPDLRGRVTGPDWWHEANTGIPVLATGLPSRLVESVSRCVGNSVVPQVLIPIMEAIASTLPPPNHPTRHDFARKGST